MSKKKALGRGLSALLSDNSSDDKLEVDIPMGVIPTASGHTTGTPPASGMTEIPIDEIEVNPFQPRTHFDQEALLELAESITVHGIIQPITVRRLAPRQYQLISGERRFQASKLAGLKETPRILPPGNGDQRSEKWRRCTYPTTHPGT